MILVNCVACSELYDGGAEDQTGVAHVDGKEQEIERQLNMVRIYNRTVVR